MLIVEGRVVDIIKTAKMITALDIAISKGIARSTKYCCAKAISFLKIEPHELTYLYFLMFPEDRAEYSHLGHVTCTNINI